MKQATAIVKAEAGLHARPASMLVKAAAGFKSSIKVEKAGKVADAKRLLSILTLGAKEGEEVTITVEGADEDVAITAIKELIETSC